MVTEVKNLDDLSRFVSSFAQVKFIKSCLKLICMLVRIYHTVISTFLDCTNTHFMYNIISIHENKQIAYNKRKNLLKCKLLNQRFPTSKAKLMTWKFMCQYRQKQNIIFTILQPAAYNEFHTVSKAMSLNTLIIQI